ncbi:protein-export chaperone SecB [Ureibacillus chungkukjangi]|uniref:Preprotein translocase subunit SecB n=1 Tax=Ureibacillus chungkukjangi TaxID=1202712 RepID=A0A318TLD0_9BACL|nr:protein-export chaperone SecB [Ureibacillus chungkukjangi]PYF05631.1 preprotein translocase subunit SecB [Ureibacillus chungkukjangi]
MKDPVIKFKGYSIQQMIYQKVDSKEGSPSSKLNLSCGISEDMKFGKIIITVEFINSEVQILLTVEGLFDVKGVESKESIEEFLTVNGTAIVYPYVRSIMSMVSSLDSNNAIILPTINTTNFID